MGKKRRSSPEKEQSPEAIEKAPQRKERVIRNAFGEPKYVQPEKIYHDRTKQSFMDECDITKIISQYRRTGIVTHLNRAQAVFEDVSEMGDYRQALQQVEYAQTLFMELPSKVRARFDNDPAAFLDFVTDPANLEEVQEMGLAPVVSKHPDVVAGNVPPDEPEQLAASGETGKQAPEGGAVGE